MQGYTRNTIAKMLNCSGQHIKNIIEKNGIKPIGHIEMPSTSWKLYDLNEIKKYFKEKV